MSRSPGPPGRVERLRSVLERKKVPPLVVTGAANVRYLTGFTGSSGALVVGSREAVFVTDFRYRVQAAKEVRHCRIVEQKESMAECLAQIVRRQRRRRIAVEGRHLSVAAHRRLSAFLGSTKTVITEGLVEGLREIKDRGEISLVRAAVAASARAYGPATRRLRGRTEAEVARRLEEEMRREGAEEAAFPSIVASGAWGALPHAVPRKRRIVSGDLVVIDFGCRCRGYHSDTTRTRLVGKGRGRKKRDLYRIVAEAQRAALAAVRPGVEASAVDAAARRVIVRAGYGEFFGHGTGHGVGLEVHEGPVISPRSGEILEPGMVFTVEPGIYLKNYGGVRIEDMVLVTESGGRVLSSAVPRNDL